MAFKMKGMGFGQGAGITPDLNQPMTQDPISSAMTQDPNQLTMPGAFGKSSTFKTVGVGSPMKASGGSCEEVLASQAYKNAAKSKKYWKRECWTMATKKDEKGGDCPTCPKEKVGSSIELNTKMKPS